MTTQEIVLAYLQSIALLLVALWNAIMAYEQLGKRRKMLISAAAALFLALLAGYRLIPLLPLSN